MEPDERTTKDMSHVRHRQAWVELTQRYLADLPRQLQAMRACLDRGDLAGLQQQAHRAKGTAGTYRLEKIAAQLARLEDRAHRDALQELPSLLDQLTALVAEDVKRCCDD